jgi:Lipocalin-like domain
MNLMKKILALTCGCIAVIAVYTSCKKSTASNGSAITVENLAGTYGLKAVTWTYLGITVNVYDSVPVCERDNLAKLNADKTVNFIDAGIVCDPAEDEDGTWDLRNDSLIFSTNFTSAKIVSFDGKTLVLSGEPEGQPGVTATTTLEKQ